MFIVSYLVMATIFGYAASCFYEPRANNKFKVLCVSFIILVIGMFVFSLDSGGISSERLIGLSAFYTFAASIACTIKKALKAD